MTISLQDVFSPWAREKRWVCWREVERDGKSTKVPVNPMTGRNASPSGPATWGTLSEAEAFAQENRVAGVGIVLGNGPGPALAGVDLDACRDPSTGEIAPWAQRIVDMFATYTEVSPSGTGVKIFATGGPDEVPLNEVPMGAPQANGRRPQVEVYVDGRYFATTGLILDGVPDEITDGSEPGGPWDSLIVSMVQRARKKKSGPKDATAEVGKEIPKGARDKTLTSLAGALRRKGEDGETILPFLRAVNEKRCKPPLPEADLVRIAKGIERYPTEEKVPVGTGEEGEEKARPRINVRQALNPVTNEAIETLVDRPDLNIYVRSGQLVTLGRDGADRHKWLKRPPGSLTIRRIEAGLLMGMLDEVAEWAKFDARAKDHMPARPPPWVAEQILSRLEWPFPYLEAVTETPTLRPDGSLLDKPGWDEDTGILFTPIPGQTWEKVPDRPTKKDAQQALEHLLDPVSDFPFLADSDRAAFVAAVLTLLGRQRIEGPTPLFAVRAPTPGTGKGLLAQVAGIIGTGRVPPAMTMAWDGDELRKRITSLAVDGSPVVLLDNLSGVVGSDVLAAALTATVWEDRILGETRMIRLPLRVVWLASGNNLGFKRTLGRRVVPIDLDAEVEAPEDRTGFQYENLLAHVRARRPQLVTAGLTILRAHHRAGSPRHGRPRMGSFEDWDDVVRSCCVWIGAGDPADTEEDKGRGRIRTQSDDDLEGLGALLETLVTIYPDQLRFSVATVLKEAEVRMARGDNELQVLLDTIAGPARGGRVTANSLGAKLRDHRNRPVKGLILRKIQRSWRVDSIGDPT